MERFTYGAGLEGIDEGRGIELAHAAAHVGIARQVEVLDYNGVVGSLQLQLRFRYGHVGLFRHAGDVIPQYHLDVPHFLSLGRHFRIRPTTQEHDFPVLSRSRSLPPSLFLCGCVLKWATIIRKGVCGAGENKVGGGGLHHQTVLSDVSHLYARKCLVVRCPSIFLFF